MLFPTIEFLIFFLAVFTITWLLNSRNALKKSFLLTASYFFYACWNWRFVFLLLFSAVLNYVAGLLIGRQAASEQSRKAAMWVAVAGNLSLLGYFKYWDFASAQLENLAALVGMPLDLGYSGIALPVAISFLTFHGLSYILDVYGGKVAPTRSLSDLMLYMAFFPHLVAGPIVRAADFLSQLSRRSDPRDIEIGPAVLLIVGGLFKKVVIASHLATLFVDPIFTNPAGFGSLDLIVGAYAYAIVIFCDFSAYTDIAIGIANLLGYRFPQNFNQPYQAVSLQDFWHRSRLPKRRSPGARRCASAFRTRPARSSTLRTLIISRRTFPIPSTASSTKILAIAPSRFWPCPSATRRKKLLRCCS